MGLPVDVMGRLQVTELLYLKQTQLERAARA